MLTSSISVAADKPASTSLQEHVGVELRQIEVTVTPKDGNLALCSELSSDSFEASTKRGVNLPIYSLDRAGAILGAPSAEGAQTLKRGPIYLGFFFDLPSLFFCPYEVGDDTVSERAYRQVREMLTSDVFRSGFKPELGDRLLLASFDGDDVRFETGWVTVEDFNPALDALKARTFLNRPRAHDRNRWAGYTNLANALGYQSETGGATKHIMLLASDFDLDTETGEQTEADIASTLQRARVIINPVDLIWDKRVLPMGIGTLSWLAQGDLFSHGATSTDAVEKVIGIYENGCRLIISIKVSSDEKLALHVRDNRFTIPAPVPLRPLPPLTNDERFEANIKLPYWGRGIRLESVFWPVKPIDRNTWSGYLLVRILLQPGEALSDDVDELMVFGTLNDGRQPLYTSLGKKDIAELRKRGSRRLVFETTVDSGSRSSRAIITAADLSVGATSQTAFTVPKRPKEGQSASWSIVGDQGTIAGKPLLLPALSPTLPDGKPLFMGYGCGNQEPGSVITAATGVVVASVPVALRSTTAGDCGWLLGTPAQTLAPGKYIFRPPQSSGGQQVRFTVAKGG